MTPSPIPPLPPLLPALEIETGPSPTASVIWLHGLGADGHDFAPVVPELRLPPGTPTRFIFPHAPEIPVTLNVGQVMPAWFDLYSFDFDAPEDVAGIARSQAAIERLIAREESRGIPSNRIVLAGFSQGGALAVYTALRHAKPLAGAMLLSTWLPLAQTLAAEASPANSGMPLLIAHGRQDDMVPIAYGQASRDALRLAGYAVEWREYDIAHAVSSDEIDDIGAWLRRIL